MIRPKGDWVRHFLLNFQQFLQNSIHVSITGKMIVFKEIALCIPLGIAQVREVNAGTQFLGHGREVVVRIGSQRTGTETDAIAFVGNGIDDEFQVIHVLYDPGQTKDVNGRIIRMDGQLQSQFITERGDLLQKIDQVAAQYIASI